MSFRTAVAAFLCMIAIAPARADMERWSAAEPTLYAPSPSLDHLPPVDLGIPNIRQQNKVWCWVAVAQQIIQKNRGSSPPQCALVAMANGRFPSYCCPGRSRCKVKGTLEQIRRLIRNFGRRVAVVIRPSGPLSLYRQLRDGRPIILALRTSARSGHVVVLTGMTWRRAGHGAEAILHINDPIGAYPPRLPFREISSQWHAAIVVY